MDLSTQFFMKTFGLDPGGLERVLGTALSREVDYADLYFEHRVFESLSLEERIVKKANHVTSQGVGVRAVAGDRTGHAHSNEIDLRQLEAAARAARVIAEGERAPTTVALSPRGPGRADLYPVAQPAIELPVGDKAELLRRADDEARGLDARVTDVQVSFASEVKTVAIVGSDGAMVGDQRPLCRLSIQVVAEAAGDRQIGTSGGGGRVPLTWFLEPTENAEVRFLFWVREAVRQAVQLLEADRPPAGTMPVVLGPGWPGILLHEAVGHGLEADFNRKGVSAFSKRLGQEVASPLCTVVDDGTIAGRRGSLNVDDEGTPTQRTVLIEDGILRGYLQDRTNARLMGMAPTGNGRRESYACIPMPRMTNTFMLPGESDPSDIIRSVKRGLYAVNFGGGQVDITSGDFVFAMSEAFVIEDGRLGRAVKGATLIGSGTDVLKRVRAVGNDLRLDEGVGTCGKEGQSVPVGVGLPTVLVDGITVGGTQ